MGGSDTLNYDPSAGADAISGVTGVLYLALVAFFLFRLFQRRAKRFTSERIGGTSTASTEDDSSDDEDEVDVRQGQPQEQPFAPTSPIKSLIGTIQFGALSVGCFYLASYIEGYMLGLDLPDNYTARNIGSALRLTVVGAAYLATFIFSANTLGLAALTLKLALFGDDDYDAAAADRRRAAREAPPKVRVTDDLDAVRAAFDQVEREAAEAKRRAAALGSNQKQSKK